MLNLQLFEDADLVIELEVGQRFALKTKVHASIGLDTDYEIDDEAILDLEEEELILDHAPKDGDPIPTGGDAGYEILEFEGKSKGTTTLHFKKVYRTEVQATKTIRVIVH
ncbi:MAG: hypothetical protein KDC44_01460 [Phaeodactylibacter sp.]|nr:hypothetical protein [Phaeodactylibacter sp.]